MVTRECHRAKLRHKVHRSSQACSMTERAISVTDTVSLTANGTTAQQLSCGCFQLLSSCAKPSMIGITAQCFAARDRICQNSAFADSNIASNSQHMFWQTHQEQCKVSAVQPVLSGRLSWSEERRGACCSRQSYSYQ